MYALIPKLLLKSNYLYYLSVLLMTAISITVADICIEYFVHRYYEIPFNPYSFFSSRSIPPVELLSGILLTDILLTGISITVFFKNWLLSMEREEALKKDKLYTQLDVLKERITPSFLLNVLHKAGESTKSAPGASSKMLLQLCRLLRYQLYDNSREAVLLSSEINFLSDYLSLENSCNENLNYTITHPPFEKNYFVPPLSFVPIVEDALETFREQKEPVLIELKFAVTGDSVVFTCKNNQKEISHRCNILTI
jgi:LytS/YehU family sensor histidine kinase